MQQKWKSGNTIKRIRPVFVKAAAVSKRSHPCSLRLIDKTHDKKKQILGKGKRKWEFNKKKSGLFNYY